MRKLLILPVALGVAVAASASGQASGAGDRRFSAAVGVTTSRLDLPQMASSSLSARLLPARSTRFQLQVDATVAARRFNSVGGVASLEGVFEHRTFGRSFYELLGVAIASNKGLTAGGVGTRFAWRNRPMFMEFRMYGPGLHTYNGFRLGTRF